MEDMREQLPSDKNRPWPWMIGLALLGGVLLVSALLAGPHGLLKGREVVLAQNASSPTAPRAASPDTVGEYLQRYFGEEWPALRSRLRPGALDENAQVEEGSIRPWAEVRKEIAAEDIIGPPDGEGCVRRALAWENEANPEPGSIPAALSATAGASLTAAARAELLDLIAGYDGPLQSLGEVAGEELIGTISERWSRDGYQATPLVPVDPPNPENKRVLFFRYLSVAHWNIVVSLFEGDCPAYDETLQEIKVVKAERLRAATEFLKKLETHEK